MNHLKPLAIIGLGYVGLPLSIAFAKKINTVIGYDLSETRINQLKSRFDITNEVHRNDLKSSKIEFSHKVSSLQKCTNFIVTVPTPIYKNKKPDLRAIRSATKLVAGNLKKGSIVIFESTVYPGLTEEICIPILEKYSNMSLNLDFSVGYSPERINPGDKKRDLSNITKVVSSSNKKSLTSIHKLYSLVVEAGVYKAPSIKVAEAAKIIENTQRDINIALMNELSIIFNKLNINTDEVLKAANTKWNFLDFTPGLVGGHCIGVDPYYLTYLSEKIGYKSKIISASRKINDDMASQVAKRVAVMVKNGNPKKTKFKALILGITFKEDCPDIRNTKVVDLVDSLTGYNFKCDCFDPYVLPPAINSELKNMTLLKNITKHQDNYDAILLCVPHKTFVNMSVAEIRKLSRKKVIFFDMKSSFDNSIVDGAL